MAGFTVSAGLCANPSVARCAKMIAALALLTGAKADLGSLTP
jgi:hypothetical protein